MVCVRCAVIKDLPRSRQQTWQGTLPLSIQQRSGFKHDRGLESAYESQPCGHTKILVLGTRFYGACCVGWVAKPRRRPLVAIRCRHGQHNRPIVMWRIAPGRRDTSARTADTGGLETRGLVHPQDPRRQLSQNHVAWWLATVLLAWANYLLSRATPENQRVGSSGLFRTHCFGSSPQSSRGHIFHPISSIGRPDRRFTDAGRCSPSASRP